MGDDIFPRFCGPGQRAPDQPTLKALTLLHDRLYFDVISPTKGLRYTFRLSDIVGDWFKAFATKCSQ